MCRLFGQISPRPEKAADFLVHSERSLLRQSNFKTGNYQKDGWGLGYYDGEEARVLKSAKAAYQEKERFISAASKIESPIILGHLRAASNPRGLPHKKLVGIKNSQPFTDGRFLFAHNGAVHIPLEIEKFLGNYRRKIRGVNDSEVYFWQFRKFYEAYGDIPQALQACIRENWTLWGECRRRYRKFKAPYTSLNALVSDGRSLHALCHAPFPSSQSSFFNPRQGWGTLSFSRRGNRLILASEDMDTGPWNHFRQSEIISSVFSGSRLSIRRKKIGEPRP